MRISIGIQYALNLCGFICVCAASILVCILSQTASAQSQTQVQAITFQDLMAPSMFPDPQFGLKVMQVAEKGSRIRIVTTGAIINIDKTSGEIEFVQRIDHQRTVALLDIGSPLGGVEVTDKGPGFARITIEKPKLTIRINGDSLFMIQPGDACEFSINSKIQVAWNASWKTNHLIVDEWGGFGIYCSELELDDHYAPLESVVGVYAMPANGVLCMGVCPPKPYPWRRSIDQQVLWHWSDKTGYPSDEELVSWTPYGNMVLLQSEVMLWKDWNLDFVPRIGLGEFERVRETIHKLKMPFIVYTSPYYFLKGTSQEKQAVNDKPGVCPGAIVYGENMPIFLDAIKRVMTDLKPDGLYFDGQYSKNPAALYALARESRKIVGDKGLLEWHSTVELGDWNGQMYIPQVDAYTDIQLRGESLDALYSDFDYMRFFVSGYNINNCIGVLCNNSGREMTPECLDELLSANARIHTLVGNQKMREFVKNEYRPRLDANLRTTVERETAERQAAVPEKVARLKQFFAGPTWNEDKPLFSWEFDSMPEAERLASNLNDNPFSVVDGCLNIKAHAHTYAYLHVPVNESASGFVARIRQSSDLGMSWGPAVAIRFNNGELVRVGVRVNQVQSDVLGAQILGPNYDHSQWIWLRARWGENKVIVECSSDGKTYTKCYVGYRKMDKADKVSEVYVGKVPYNAKPADNSDPGESGECSVDFFRLYE
jgi:hypothetical protein